MSANSHYLGVGMSAAADESDLEKLGLGVVVVPLNFRFKLDAFLGSVVGPLFFDDCDPLAHAVIVA